MPKTSPKTAPVPILATMGALYSRFRPAILSQRGLIFGALVLVLGAVGFRLAEPWPLKFVFDGLMMPQAAPDTPITGIGLLDSLPWPVLLTILIGAFVGIVLIHSALTFLSKMAMALAFRRLLADARKDIFDHLLHMSILRHHGYGNGDLANRVTVDIDRIRLAGTNNAINLIVNVLTMAGMLLVMFWVNWQLALIAFTAVPLFHVLSRALMPRITANAREFRASDGVLASETVHAATAVETIQGLSLFDRVLDGLDRDSRKNLKLGMRGTILKTVLRQSVMLLFAVIIGLLIWRGAVLVGAGMITPGDLIIFMSYLREGMEKPMVRFSVNLADIGRAAASGERLLTLLNEAPAPKQGRYMPDQPVRGEICFKDVSFRYPGGPLILDRVNLTLRPGERAAITGPSGSGKSTLFALLLRLYDPESGDITLDGVSLRDYQRDALTQTMTAVFQNNMLFAGSLRDNLTLGNDAISDETIWQALHEARSDSFVKELSEGLDYPLPFGGGTLSGGQAQRLGIARAFLRSSPILLLDEPTSALDPKSRNNVLASICGSAWSKSVLMITHQSDGLDAFDRVYRLEEGHLQELPPALHVLEEVKTRRRS